MNTVSNGRPPRYLGLLLTPDGRRMRGLSRIAKVGLIGVPVTVLLAALCMWWSWRALLRKNLEMLTRGTNQQKVHALVFFRYHPDERAHPVILRLLQSAESRPVRLQCLVALITYGNTSDIPAVSEFLDDPDKEVREQAERTIEGIRLQAKWKGNNRMERSK